MLEEEEDAMPGETTTRTPTADEITGVHNVPPPGYAPMVQPPLMSRDSWVRIFLWIIPIIFTAGALFVSVQAMTQRQDEQERAIKAEQDRGAKLESDQRVMQGTVQSISTQQDKIEVKVDAIDTKLDNQAAQLSAISERLGANPRHR